MPDITPVDGPVHKPRYGGHENQQYVGSFSAPRKAELGYERVVCDVYVSPDKVEAQKVCIRWGEGASEFLSPGSLFKILDLGSMFPNAVMYNGAAATLRLKGVVVWYPFSPRDSVKNEKKELIVV